MPHTPGPWVIEWPDASQMDSGPMILAQGGRAVVAEVLQPVADEDGPARGTDDARLIAAAPDLLDAAFEARSILLSVYPDPDQVRQTIAALDAAIQKAKE